MTVDPFRAARVQKLRQAIKTLEEALRISKEYLRQLEETERRLDDGDTEPLILRPDQSPHVIAKNVNIRRF